MATKKGLITLAPRMAMVEGDQLHVYGMGWTLTYTFASAEVARTAGIKAREYMETHEVPAGITAVEVFDEVFQANA